MASLNKVCLIGNITRDPELRTLGSGTKLAKTGIAVNESWKDDSGNKQERTTFVNLSFFGAIADVVMEYVHSGKQVYVEGKLRITKDEKVQPARYFTEVVIDRQGTLQMLGSKGDGDKPARKKETVPPTNEPVFASDDNGDGDIPF